MTSKLEILFQQQGEYSGKYLVFDEQQNYVGGPFEVEAEAASFIDNKVAEIEDEAEDEPQVDYDVDTLEISEDRCAEGAGY
jgi:hypothetical protein